jgi:HEAT repeat protein
MPAASSPVRPRLASGPPPIADGHHRWMACLALFPLIGVLVLGCGKADTADSQDGQTQLSRPQLDLEVPESLAGDVDRLYSESPADRAYAASQLGKFGAEARPVVPLLVDRLGDPDWQVRRQAAEALGALGDSMAVDPLIEILSDRNGEWSVRAAAARSLGRLGDPRAVEALIAVLNDMNAHVRHMAVIALGQIGTPETVEPLVAAARGDSDGATRFSAAQAIRRLENVPSESDSP